MRSTCLAYGGFAYGGESFPNFRTSEGSLDHRQLNDIPFHRTPDTRCLRRSRSLYNARREQAVYRSFKTQAFEWCSSAAISYPTNHARPCPFNLGGHGTRVSRILLADGISAAIRENTTSTRRYLVQLSAEPCPPTTRWDRPIPNTRLCLRNHGIQSVIASWVFIESPLKTARSGRIHPIRKTSGSLRRWS